MMECSKVAQILSEKPAVVQMPQRAYPALAVQGDTLAVWRQRASEIAALATGVGNEKLIAACDDLRDKICSAFDGYNAVCREQKHGGFSDGRQRDLDLGGTASLR